MEITKKTFYFPATPAHQWVFYLHESQKMRLILYHSFNYHIQFILYLIDSTF